MQGPACNIACLHGQSGRVRNVSFKEAASGKSAVSQGSSGGLVKAACGACPAAGTPGAGNAQPSARATWGWWLCPSLAGESCSSWGASVSREPAPALHNSPAIRAFIQVSRASSGSVGPHQQEPQPRCCQSPHCVSVSDGDVDGDVSALRLGVGGRVKKFLLILFFFFCCFHTIRK